MAKHGTLTHGIGSTREQSKALFRPISYNQAELLNKDQQDS